MIEIWKKVFKKVIFRTTLPLLFAVAASCTREGGALRTDSAPFHIKCRAVLLLSLLSSVRAFQREEGEEKKTTIKNNKRKRMKKTFALLAFPLLSSFNTCLRYHFMPFVLLLLPFGTFAL